MVAKYEPRVDLKQKLREEDRAKQDQEARQKRQADYLATMERVNKLHDLAKNVHGEKLFREIPQFSGSDSPEDYKRKKSMLDKAESKYPDPRQSPLAAQARGESPPEARQGSSEVVTPLDKVVEGPRNYGEARAQFNAQELAKSGQGPAIQSPVTGQTRNEEISPGIRAVEGQYGKGTSSTPEAFAWQQAIVAKYPEVAKLNSPQNLAFRKMFQAGKFDPKKAVAMTDELAGAHPAFAAAREGVAGPEKEPAGIALSPASTMKVPNAQVGRARPVSDLLPKKPAPPKSLPERAGEVIGNALPATWEATKSAAESAGSAIGKAGSDFYRGMFGPPTNPTDAFPRSSQLPSAKINADPLSPASITPKPAKPMVGPVKREGTGATPPLFDSEWTRPFPEQTPPAQASPAGASIGETEEQKRRRLAMRGSPLDAVV